MLTSHHDDVHIFPAIKAGALSYLLKDVGPEDLAGAIRPQCPARREVPNPFAELTDRESEVLCLVAEGLPNVQIAERLVLSEQTVKGHISNILGKLYLADRTQAAMFAWWEGMMRSD